MDTDAKLDATFGWKADIALDHAVLHLDGAAYRVDHAAELNDGSIAGALDYAPIVNGDYRVDQIAPKRPQPRQYAILVYPLILPLSAAACEEYDDFEASTRRLQ